MTQPNAITGPPRLFTLGPPPIGEHAGALAAEQARLAGIASVYRGYQLAYAALDFVARDGLDL